MGAQDELVRELDNRLAEAQATLEIIGLIVTDKSYTPDDFSMSFPLVRMVYDAVRGAK